MSYVFASSWQSMKTGKGKNEGFRTHLWFKTPAKRDLAYESAVKARDDWEQWHPSANKWFMQDHRKENK